MTVKEDTRPAEEGGEKKSQTAKKRSANVAILTKIVAVGAVGIIVLEVLMLLFDERFPWLFPFVFGIDLRYVFTIGLAVVVGIVGILRAIQSTHHDDPSDTKTTREPEDHNQ